MATQHVASIEVVLENKAITPETLKVSDLVKVLENFERLLVEMIVQDNPMLQTQEVVIGLVEVKTGSVGLGFVPQLHNQSLAAFGIVAEAINRSEFSRFTSIARDALTELTRFSRTRQCAITFVRREGTTAKRLASITPTMIVDLPKSLHGETTLYGEVRSVGGAKPNMHLKVVDDEREIVCDVTKQQAQKLAGYLYQRVGVQGEAEWLLPEMKVSRFKVNEIVPQEQVSIFDTFKELRAIVGGQYDHIEDVVGYTKHLRQEETE